MIDSTPPNIAWAGFLSRVHFNLMGHSFDSRAETSGIFGRQFVVACGVWPVQNESPEVAPENV